MAAEPVRPGPGHTAASLPPQLPAAYSGVERTLWEACERAMRQPRDRLVVVAHLSRLTPPLPHPHHQRAIRAILQATAQWSGGQVFVMRNHDVVLVCARNAASQTDAVSDPERLPAQLAKLFTNETPDPGSLVSLWPLDRSGSALQAYLEARASEPGEAAGGEAPSIDLAGLASLQNKVADIPLVEMLTQQIGMSLSADRSRPLVARLAPAFCALDVSADAAPVRDLVVAASADAYLGRHVAAIFEARLLQALDEDITALGRLTRPARAARLPLHVELGPDSVFSPAFSRLARLLRAAGLRLGVAVSLMEAVADVAMMEDARKLLGLSGCDFILNRIDPAVLKLIRPGLLQPDRLTLAWSRSTQGQRQLDLIGPALAGLDPARIILLDVDSDQALVWGQAHGIIHFQGPFLDQIQAATRMAGCRTAEACTLRQCRGRAAARSPRGRAGCASPALLDPGDPRGEHTS